MPLGVGNDLAGSVRQPAHAWCAVSSSFIKCLGKRRGLHFDAKLSCGVFSSRILSCTVADLRIVADSLELVQTREEPSCSQRIAVWEDAGIIEPSGCETSDS